MLTQASRPQTCTTITWQWLSGNSFKRYKKAANAFGSNSKTNVTIVSTILMFTLHLWTGPLLSGRNLRITLALVSDTLLRKTIRRRLMLLSRLPQCWVREMTRWISTNVGLRSSTTAVSLNSRPLCKTSKPGLFSSFQTSASTLSPPKTMNSWLYVASN